MQSRAIIRRDLLRMLRRTGAALILLAAARVASGDALNCTLTEYTPQPGLTATVAAEALTLVWEAEKGSEVRLRLANERGVPIVEEVAVRNRGGTWATVVAHATPEFRVVTGLRRMSNQLRGDRCE